MVITTLGAASGLAMGGMRCSAPTGGSNTNQINTRVSSRQNNSSNSHRGSLSAVAPHNAHVQPRRNKEEKRPPDRLSDPPIEGCNLLQIAAPEGAPQPGQNDGLPEELYLLLDPTQPVQLSVLRCTGPLDNWKLDKLVASLGRNRATWRRALVLYDWLKDCGHSLDDRLCTTLIRMCADHGDAVSALGVYEWMRSPKRAGGGELAPTNYTYTAAMRAAMAANLLPRALQVWEDSVSAGVTPDCRLCLTYIELCTRLGYTERAMAMYTKMKVAPVSANSPTVHVYTAAMRAASDGGQWLKALDVWADMQRAGIEPTGHAYAAVITACASGSDWVRALSLFEEMSSRGIRPDVVSCTALITALASAGEAAQARNVVEWMLRNKLKPNVRTYTALIRAMGNAKEWGQAMEMLYFMQLPEWGAVQPNAYTYSALLKSLGEHGQWQLAEAVFSHLEQQVLSASGSSSSIRANNSSMSPLSSSSGHAATPSPLGQGGAAQLGLPHNLAACAQHQAGNPKQSSLSSLGPVAASQAGATTVSGGLWSPVAGAGNSGSNMWGSSTGEQGGGGHHWGTVSAAAAAAATAAAAASAEQGASSQQWGTAGGASAETTATPAAGPSDQSNVVEPSKCSGMWSSASQLNGISLLGGAGVGAVNSTASASTPAAAPAPASDVGAPLSARSAELNLKVSQALPFSTSTPQSGGTPSLPSNLDISISCGQSDLGKESFSLYSQQPFNQGNPWPGYGTMDTNQYMYSSELGRGLPLDTSMRASSPLLLQSLSIQASATIADQLSAISALASLNSWAANTPLGVGGARGGGQGPQGVRTGAGGGGKMSHGGEKILNEVVCGALMFSYERAGKWEEAVGVLDRARSLGLRPNHVMYNTAISAAGKAGKLEVVEQLFAKVAEPDTITYETLLAAYGMAGLPGKAEAVFRTMVYERGFIPRDYAYCGLIAAHSLAGDVTSALAVRQRMCRDGAPITVHVYNALLAACERGGQYSRALELYTAMCKEGLEPNVVTQQLMAVIGRRGVANVESQQVATAALSAAFAAAGSILMQRGLF